MAHNLSKQDLKIPQPVENTDYYKEQRMIFDYTFTPYGFRNSNIAVDGSERIKNIQRFRELKT